MNEKTYLTYKVEISTITPLHIGNGTSLLHEYDYAIHNGHTWRINDAALLDAQNVEDPRIAGILARTPPAQLLKPGDYVAGNTFFRYVIPGSPRSIQEGAQLQEQIKDVYDRPYLPGSSLKGAIRTALAWNIWQDEKMLPEERMLTDQRKSGNYLPGKFAAQNYEHQIFGKDPNHDFLRALHVSDSNSLPPESMMILNTRILSQSGKLKPPVELEAIHPDKTFEMYIKLDLALYSDWAKQHHLALAGEKYLRSLPQQIMRHAEDRILFEKQWFSEVNTAKKIFNFYNQLSKVTPANNQCLLQLGWGTGWDDKTYGSQLKTDNHFMDFIIDHYHLTKDQNATADTFPNTRNVAVSFIKDAKGSIMESPASPLGWILMEMERV